MKTKIINKPDKKPAAASRRVKSTVALGIEEIINNAVQKGLQAGRLQTDTMIKDTFKATEKRLYALPTLLLKVEDDKEWVERILIYGAPERSNSIVRFGASGVRLSEDEIVEALVMDMNAKIAADEHEIDTMQRALGTIEDDAYYEIVNLKYFDMQNDEEIAKAMFCDPSTVRRNKNRLIQRLTIYLYGSRVVV